MNRAKSNSCCWYAFLPPVFFHWKIEKRKDFRQYMAGCQVPHDHLQFPFWLPQKVSGEAKQGKLQGAWISLFHPCTLPSHSAFALFRPYVHLHTFSPTCTSHVPSMTLRRTSHAHSCTFPDLPDTSCASSSNNPDSSRFSSLVLPHASSPAHASHTLWPVCACHATSLTLSHIPSSFFPRVAAAINFLPGWNWLVVGSGRKLPCLMIMEFS